MIHVWYDYNVNLANKKPVCLGINHAKMKFKHHSLYNGFLIIYCLVRPHRENKWKEAELSRGCSDSNTAYHWLSVIFQPLKCKQYSDRKISFFLI